MDFFTNEGHPNYFMLAESLLPYVLDKYTLHRTLTITITIKFFYCKANYFQVSNNYKISMESSIFL